MLVITKNLKIVNVMEWGKGGKDLYCVFVEVTVFSTLRFGNGLTKSTWATYKSVRKHSELIREL